MRNIFALVLMVVLAGCQVREEQRGTGGASPTRGATANGAMVAGELTRRYQDTRVDCGQATMPAFLCSGIVLRSTVPSTQYSSWNPSPHSQQSGGVSFSFLRKDSKFRDLVFGQINGFIFYPVLATPPGIRQIEVLCSYPIDGWSQLRDKPGCGGHPYYPLESRRCQTLGISTAEQWMAHWQRAPAPSNAPAYQCSFDVRDSMNHLAADSFYQSIRTRNMLGASWFPQQNELILATWSQNIPRELPIQAFFYLYTPGGLAGAQHDQRDFYNKSGGMVVPIVQMVLPASPSEEALFAYYPADQIVP
ncbi:MULTISPECIES: hypothetical protein [Pseudomonas]|uniref:Halovibrin HvnA n=1 Tax=Pseudomonas lini TaxID=163011 RepID=A0A0J6HP60_9PSED|nr:MULTISPECIES: hypothetical protein [Pseudomonas]KAB0507137.1 halovibrin HvnA [Pseudomonas lini]KMM95575.1 halovibrin HvnA [Pseudomonas lini]KNH44142.1 halovibrin HvnA [Pseudomonas lini]MDT9673130.1 halovibrin HvnA [Pseudomonas sp. JV414]NSX07355.1 halovibrin HvnA [Pseudomonas lini]